MNNTKIRDENNKPVPSNKKSETLADYFATKQWGQNKKAGATATELLFETMADMKIGKFTLEEFEKARLKIDNGKTPGTDGVPGEFIKWLNTNEAEEIILGDVAIPGKIEVLKDEEIWVADSGATSHCSKSARGGINIRAPLVAAQGITGPAMLDKSKMDLLSIICN